MMLRKLTVVLLSAGALALGGCNNSSTPTDACTEQPSPCKAFAAGATGQSIITAVAGAAANTTFGFAAGTYTFTNTITLPKVNGLRFVGAGSGSTTFDFSGLPSGTTGEGILTTSGTSNITFEKFAVTNTPGDGIKAEGVTGVYFQDVKVSWSSADNTKHGSYGIYPVSSTNVSISGCQVGILNADGTGSGGARDTGIYVGQSANIIVSNNKVYGNVSGIEIETSVGADVLGNTSTANTAGILVFSLPNIHVPNGTSANSTTVHVANNTITNNNTLNFGDPSGTVYAVPGGTGILVLAADNVEINNNTLSGNHTIAIAVASYCTLNPTFCMTIPFPDPNLNPFANNVYVHNNTFSGNGTSPILTAADGNVNQFGGLFTQLLPAFPSHVVPDIDWDGVALEAPPVNYVPPQPGATAGTPPNPISVFIQANTSSTNAGWCNLNFPVLAANLPTIDPTALNFNAAPFTVTATPTGFPLPAISVPGAP
jgi:parallel beta-helix repeat protein